jgi:hypothetical protein
MTANIDRYNFVDRVEYAHNMQIKRNKKEEVPYIV